METGLNIEELAAETGLSVRTVRYYISRGLIQGANTRGRGATYEEDHLLRLRLIRRWSERGVSLSDMQQRLADPLLDVMQSLLEEDRLAEQVSSPAVQRSPQEFVRTLLQRAQATAHASAKSASGEGDPTLTGVPEAPTWRHLTLLPGLELQIRTDHEEAYRSLIQRIRLLAISTHQ